MKLISMTDFVLKLDVAENTATYKQDYNRIIDYANFFKQPLTLGMFVPCDDDGNVLEEPSKNGLHFRNYLKIYDKAKSKVLFKGFIEQKSHWFSNGFLEIDEEFICNKRIEHLVPYSLDLAVSF